MASIAIETSSAYASVALMDGQEVIVENNFTDSLTVGGQLLTRLEELLASAGVDLGDVTGIAVSIGPGSYTGIRLGVTAAKTLAFARQLPLVGVESLRVLAAGVRQAGEALPEAADSLTVSTVLDGRQSFLYGALFEVRKGISPLPQSMRQILPQTVDDGAALWHSWVRKLRSEASTRPMLVIGNGADACLEYARSGESLDGVKCVRGAATLDWPRARVVGQLASDALAEARWDPEAVHRMEPLYLRATEAERRAMEASEP